MPTLALSTPTNNSVRSATHAQTLELRAVRGDQEWSEVRALCCLTGAAGNPIDRARWRFFGEQWVGPYERLRPEWAYVALKGGRVVGYLTGCPDTARFEREKRWFVDVPLLLKIAAGRFDRRSGDVARFARRALRLEKSPEQFFSAATHALLRSKYPAHLHVNVAAEARGAGVGAALAQKYFERLRAAGVGGVHVFCGKKPVPFYERLGFEALEVIEYPLRVDGAVSTAPVYAMAGPLFFQDAGPK